jgi:predicted methyltransferase
MKSLRVMQVAALALVLSACAAQSSKPDPSVMRAAIEAAVASPDRPAKDREQDEKRMPVKAMQFFGVAPGMKILDMFALTGWYTELLSRVVGPKGEVYMQNPPEVLERRGDKEVVERLAGNRLPNVVRWDKPLNDMGLKDSYFDGTMVNLVYHDFFWLSNDVDDITRDLYKALKPGGFVALVDHAAPPGTGTSYAVDRRGQHRIDEDVVKQKFKAAGFVLEAESDMMRVPGDDRTKAFFAPEMQGKNTDKFVLRFRKPR